jgi:hypothetical protein
MKMRRNVFGLVYFFIFVFISVNQYVLSSDQEEDRKPYIKFIAKNIGQGSCNIVEMFDPAVDTDPSFMVIDAGSRSYLNEHLSFKHFMERFEQKKLEEAEISLPPQGFSTPLPQSRQMIPKSTMRDLSTGARKLGRRIAKEDQPAERKRLKEVMISRIRSSLSSGRQKSKDISPPIHVKTIIVSHEDGDHCSLYPDIIKKNR